MSLWHYLFASLRHYRRIHMATAAGVATAAAIIAGALIVGDSVRGSLRSLAVDGLERIEALLQSDAPFREALADAWPNAPQIAARYSRPAPLLMARGTAVRQTKGAPLRAARLQVWGVGAEFWSLAAGDENRRRAGPRSLQGDEAALSSSVARELGVAQGDLILVTLPLRSQAPADSPLGEKEETSASRRFRVSAILSPEEGDAMARLSLYPNQQAPRNVFLPLEALQSMLDLPHKINALALARQAGPADDGSPASPLGNGPLPASEIAEMISATRPALADYGVRLQTIVPATGTGDSFVQIDSEHLILSPQLVETAERVFADKGLQPSIVALANRISFGDKSVPYSTVVGVDSTPALGPLRDAEGKPIKLSDDETALNDWTARELGIQVGDSLSIAYYEPETTHGKLVEAPLLKLKVRAIVPLTDAQGNPTRAVDPQLAPELPGVTDQQTINDWDLPFELIEPIRDQDETYWKEFRTTPKAFVSLACARRLWTTRWGAVTALRLPLSALSDRSVETAARELEQAVDPARLGIRVVPVRNEALAAASGTTPFEGLFLGFSFFLLASALALAALLFRLGAEQRASEAGVLLAVGFTPRRLLGAWLAEGCVAALVGALAGSLLGAAYAKLMIHGLNTWWVGATTTPFLRLHASWSTAFVGGGAAFAAALTAIGATLRTLVRLPTPGLLAGDAQGPVRSSPSASFARTSWLALALLAGAVALGSAAWGWGGAAQAGAFLGSGALTLGAGLTMARGWLRGGTFGALRTMNLWGLAARSARRRPARSLLSLALAASASFLIVGLGAFRLGPTEHGRGGFDWIATSDVPLHANLNDAASRKELGFSAAENDRLVGATFVGFRVNDGADASCLNLYQIAQPRVLGAPPEIGGAARFAWADHADLSDAELSNAVGAELPDSANADADDDARDHSPAGAPDGERRGDRRKDATWGLLERDLGTDAQGRPIIPLVLDQSTAQYGLKLQGVGDRMTIRDGFDRPTTLEVVGLLANSVLQGDLVIGQQNFLELFPDAAGQRFFLIRTPGENRSHEEIAETLERKLEDFGFDLRSAGDRLSELMAVQNTYLTTFQSLGGLGLLLGAVGLAVAQLRSVLERRSELALLRAVGFPRSRLGRLVLAENAALLLAGLGIGVAAALAAVAPQAAANQTTAPWGTLAALIGGTAVAGIAAGWLAVRAALRAPLLAALRGD